MLLHKAHTWEKSGSWDISQNTLDQSDCRIFKSTIYVEQMDEIARFLVYSGVILGQNCIQHFDSALDDLFFWNFFYQKQYKCDIN